MKMTSRRTVITKIAAVIGGVGVVAASIPFVRYFLPSERAKALGSPISVDLSSFQEGEARSYVWRGQTVVVLRRSQAHLEALNLTDERLLDDKDADDWQPDYVDSKHRAMSAEYLVLLGNCTHLGCVPALEIEQGRSLMGDWWPGGFTCACHGSVYDYAGRVVRGPAPRNLKVPPHYFVSANTVVIGVDAADA